jgi:hypothetical protein
MEQYACKRPGLVAAYYHERVTKIVDARADLAFRWLVSRHDAGVDQALSDPRRLKAAPIGHMRRSSRNSIDCRPLDAMARTIENINRGIRKILEMKKVLQKLNRTPTTFALEPPCMSPSVPQAPDRWCTRQKKSTSGMALKERFNSGPR